MKGLTQQRLWNSRLCGRSCRGIHTVPGLPYETSNGIPGLYSPQGFKAAWTDYQTWLTEKLNSATAETSDATRFPFHILLASSRSPRSAHVFNYASQLHNNHLFFINLSADKENAANKPSASLQKRIDQVFGGLDGLKRAIKAESAKIQDQGHIFLVETPSKQLALITSNGAGTPYSPGRYQQVDLNAPPSDDDEALLRETREAVAANVTNRNVALLSLNLWQYAYLTDFGVKGRDEFVDAWWAVIDWHRVSQRLYR